MATLDRLRKIAGLGTNRSKALPVVQLVTDGLVVTDTRATAWFRLATKNTDTLPEEQVDAELDAVVKAVPPLIEGREMHLRLVWGTEEGASYLDELEGPTAWDDQRADYLDTYEVLQRHALVGVVLEADRQSQGQAIARQKTGAALGLPGGKVTRRELRWLHGQARALAQALSATPWNVELAPVEELAWAISRDMHRNTPLPKAGTITGSGLAQLTAGHIDPYSDHLVARGVEGDPARYIAVLPLSELPETITTPGPQEWLRTLADVTRVDAEGREVPVVVEASVRWTALPATNARNKVEETRKLAREQRKSAEKHSAGETTQDVAETETLMESAKTNIEREGSRLIDCHPRVIVSESSLDDLRASIAAVRVHFSQIGINVLDGADEQRELWLEHLLVDQTRVDDLVQNLDAYAFFGAWWWGGSEVGDPAGTGSRMIGIQTGSTPGIVRSSLTAGARRGDATTTAYIGRSGRGKTTALMLGELDACQEPNSWAVHLSFKGDDLALADVARDFGVNAHLASVGAANSGAADLFRSLGREEAPLSVHRQLQLLAPRHLAAAADTVLLEVIQEHANETAEPSTWGVIQKLLNHPTSEEARQLGSVYEVAAKSSLGAPILGPPTGSEALSREPGLWVLHFPGLTLPDREVPRDDWDLTQKVSLALMRAFITHAVTISGDPALRSMSKLIVIPEVHILLATADGTSFLGNIARLGRALNTNLAFDTQDTAIEKVAAIMEQLSTLYLFQLLSRDEQDAGARMLGLPAGEESRKRIRDLGISNDPLNPVRHGHCLMRDPRQQTATVHIVRPSDEVSAKLSTTPDGYEATEADQQAYAEYRADYAETDEDDDSAGGTEDDTEHAPEPAGV